MFYSNRNRTANIGLFFGSSTGNSETIARMIAERFKPFQVDIFDVMHANAKNAGNYKNLIFGVPAWNKNLLQDDWDDFLPGLRTISLKKQRIALYGLGDQVTYSDNFADGMGHLYDWLIEKDANIVGFWPVTGYHFRQSHAQRDGHFVGLVLDEDVQFKLTAQRIELWVNGLIKEFRL